MNNSQTTNLLADALESYTRKKAAARGQVATLLNSADENVASRYSSYVSQLSNVWVHAS